MPDREVGGALGQRTRTMLNVRPQYYGAYPQITIADDPEPSGEYTASYTIPPGEYTASYTMELGPDGVVHFTVSDPVRFADDLGQVSSQCNCCRCTPISIAPRPKQCQLSPEAQAARAVRREDKCIDRWHRWQEAQRRERALQAQRERARRKAKKLLLSLLNDTQQAQFAQHRRFEVIGSLGGRYLITDAGYSYNVWLLKAPFTECSERGYPREAVATLCAHPSMSEHGADGARYVLPVHDVMVAQLLTLITDEKQFFEIANVTPVHSGYQPNRDEMQDYERASRHLGYLARRKVSYYYDLAEVDLGVEVRHLANGLQAATRQIGTALHQLVEAFAPISVVLHTEPVDSEPDDPQAERPNRRERDREARQRGLAGQERRQRRERRRRSWNTGWLP